jgi:hypothetical protein
MRARPCPKEPPHGCSFYHGTDSERDHSLVGSRRKARHSGWHRPRRPRADVPRPQLSLVSLNLGLPLSRSAGLPSRFRPLAPISTITSVTSRWPWPPSSSPSGWRSSLWPGRDSNGAALGPLDRIPRSRDRRRTGSAVALRLWPRHAGPSWAHLLGRGYSARGDPAGVQGPGALSRGVRPAGPCPRREPPSTGGWARRSARHRLR